MPAKQRSDDRSEATSDRAKPGDRIVVDSRQVGTPPRDGEVVEVVEGSVRVSYRIRWDDGHESLFTPEAGSIQIAR
jgi:hypothetical protein